MSDNKHGYDESTASQLIAHTGFVTATRLRTITAEAPRGFAIDREDWTANQRKVYEKITGETATDTTGGR